jgi:hypothetical protein
VSDALDLNLQLNYVYKARDKGAGAEPEDSGGQTLSLAPGVTYPFSPTVQLYTFVSLRVYRYVNGVQLTADWAAAAGVSVQFEAMRCRSARLPDLFAKRYASGRNARLDADRKGI